jgi:hypothetical protein
MEYKQFFKANYKLTEKKALILRYGQITIE